MFTPKQTFRKGNLTKIPYFEEFMVASSGVAEGHGSRQLVAVLTNSNV